MSVSTTRVSIATVLLCFFSVSAFAAPKIAKDGKTTTNDTRTVVAPEKREPVSRTVTPVKEPVQTVTDIGATVPAEVKPSTSVPATETTPTAVSGQAAAYSIDWFVIASGGGSGSSTNYAMDGTVGQSAVGEGTSTNYGLNSGFWQNFTPPGCCVGIRGDVNNDGAVNPNILDLTYLVDRIFRGGPPPGPCP